MVSWHAWENEGLYIPDTTTQAPKLNVGIVAGGLMVTMTYKLPHQPLRTIHHPLKQVHKQGKARRKLLKRYRVARYWNRRHDGPTRVSGISVLFPAGRYSFKMYSAGWPDITQQNVNASRKSLWQRIGEWL